MKFNLKILPSGKKWYPCVGKRGYSLGMVVLQCMQDAYSVGQAYFGCLGPLNYISDAESVTILVGQTPVAELRKA